jgi:hypothetical protein
MSYLLNLLIALDQLTNALLAGHADETLSARAHRTERDGKRFGKFFRPLIDALMFFDPYHCAKAYAAERERRQLPPEYR